MKKIKYFLLIAILSISGYSCSDFLDIKPENQIIYEDFWQKESDVEAVVLSCYRTMMEDDFMRRVILWGELRSDNMTPLGGAEEDDKRVHDVNILPTNRNSQWHSFYRVINYCNIVLKYAPEVIERDANFTESDLRAKEAEVRGIRSLCYFYLLRTFRDIPFTYEATVSDEDNLQIPQSKPEDVLDAIIIDLLEAEKWALNTFTTSASTKGRITKDAVRAILADVYLWKGDYEKCIEYCDKLIKATVMEMNNLGEDEEVVKFEFIEYGNFVSDLLFFEKNASESIFELQFNSEKGNQGVWDYYRNIPKNEAGQFSASTIVAENTDLFTSTDIRKASSIRFPKTSAGTYSIFKYLGYANVLSSVSGSVSAMYVEMSQTANWIFYRISDIMLMKAEALVQLNRSEQDLREALSIVNKTYMRANVTLLETDTLSFDRYGQQGNMEKLVMMERQRELLFEGKRWFDLLRHAERNQSPEYLVEQVVRKYSTDANSIKSKLSIMNALYMPINRDELIYNPLLVQNPYYQTSSNIVK